MSFVINNPDWEAFDLDPGQRMAFEKALSAAGKRVHKTINRVPYDAAGNAIDGPKVREILQAVKAGRVPSVARPAPHKAKVEAPQPVAKTVPNKPAPTKKGKKPPKGGKK